MVTPARAATGVGVGPEPSAALEAALETLTARLAGAQCDVACAFIGSAYSGAAAEIAGALAGVTRQASIGVTAQGVVADAAELEQPEALVVWGLAADGIEATATRYDSPDDGGVEWPPPPSTAHGLIMLADPFTFRPDAFLGWLAQARPDLPVVGGLASGGARPGGNRLLIDGAVHDGGAVGLALGGPLRLRTLVSQGCRPVGQPLVVTAAERNLITGLAGAPPTEQLRALYQSADEHDRELLRSGLQLGVVIDEYAESHEPGGFLIRPLLGAQTETGALAVGGHVHVGQTVQFHVRDADSADADLRALLDGFATATAPAGGLLFTCNGRGTRLFGAPDHDAALVHAALGGVPLAGFFAAGELGPVAGRSAVHGFTASLLTVEAEGQG